MTEATNPASLVRVYRDEAGEWRWTAEAGNHETVADSAEGYTHRDHAREMAERLFPGAGIRVEEEGEQ